MSDVSDSATGDPGIDGPGIDDPDIDDPDAVSEVLDGEVLGKELDDDDELPGVADYPPDRPLGVDDPSVGGDDDVATRDWRTEDELDGIPDDGVADTDLLPAEEAALHVADEP